MRIKVNEEKARELGRILYEIGLEKVLLIEESDPQLHAVSRVASTTSTGWAAVTASLVGLVSYRLAMKGEDWWNCYGEYFSETKNPSLDSAYKRVISFIEDCPGAAIQRASKKRRIEKAFRGAWKPLLDLYSHPQRILASGSWLLNSFAAALKQEPWRKTIAFSVKMAYYAAKSLDRGPVPAPWDVPIPVDLRVSCITYSSGIVSARDWREVMRYPQTAIKAWDQVAREARIPPLNIDSILWMVGSVPKRIPVERARRMISERLSPILGYRAVELSYKLVERSCT